MSSDQANQAADILLEQARKELGARQNKRAQLAMAEKRRRESPVFPAFFAAIAVYVAMGYSDNALVVVMLGAAVGGLFGWAARRS